MTQGAIEGFIKGFRDVIPNFAKAVLDAGGAAEGGPPRPDDGASNAPTVAGTVQLLLFTSRGQANGYEHDSMDFLNGLRVSL